MQSTGQTLTQAVSLVLMHGSVITYAISRSSLYHAVKELMGSARAVHADVRPLYACPITGQAPRSFTVLFRGDRNTVESIASFFTLQFEHLVHAGIAGLAVLGRVVDGQLEGRALGVDVGERAADNLFGV